MLGWVRARQRRRGMSSALLLLTAVCGLAASEVRGAESSAAALEATTSHAARREAIQAIPVHAIAKTHRRAVQQVLNRPSLYRRMPTQIVDCNPELFTFLARNPELLVEMWKKLEISRVDLVRTGRNTFRLADNAGTTGELVIVEQKCDDRAQNRIVMYAQGAYEGKPFKRPVRAECVLLLRSGSIRETNGRDYVAARLDSFVRIDRASIELFAKAVHPWVGKTADANFADTMTFVSNLSRAAETRPATVERLVSSLPRVSQPRKIRMVSLAHKSAQGQSSGSRVAQRTGASHVD